MSDYKITSSLRAGSPSAGEHDLARGDHGLLVGPRAQPEPTARPVERGTHAHGEHARWVHRRGIGDRDLGDVRTGGPLRELRAAAEQRGPVAEDAGEAGCARRVRGAVDRTVLTGDVRVSQRVV